MNHALKILIFTTCFSLSCLSLQAVRAEGGDSPQSDNIQRSTGNYGVNRRVVTHTGYTEVEGNFDMTFHLPTERDVAGTVVLSKGPYGDFPSPYLGGGGPHVNGGTVEVDAGLQYDNVLGDDGKVKGWGYFLRNTNPDTNGNGDAQYNQPQYWSELTTTSKKWRSGATDKLTDAYLKYIIHQGNDPATPAAEQAGWFSLTMNKLHDEKNAAGAVIPDSNLRVYWTHPQITAKVRTAIAAGATNQIQVKNIIGMVVGGTIVVGTETKTITAVTRTTTRDPVTNALEVWGTITANSNFVSAYAVDAEVKYSPPNNLVSITTTVQSGGTIGTNKVVVASVVGLEPLEEATIGTEDVIVQSINVATKELTITNATGAFTASHAFGENIIQTLDPSKAYTNHPAAPWRGTVIFDPTKLNQNRVKRIVAMTRTTGNRYELDGSWLQCTFSGGRVRKLGEAAGGHSWGAGYPTGGGDPLDVDQGDTSDPSKDVRFTAYDVPRNRAAADPPEYTGVTAWDRQWPWHIDKTSTSKTIVSFPNLNIDNIEARRNTLTSWQATEGGNSRYTRETVSINLRTVTRLQGEFVER